ncbi:F-box/LRR-repeat protein 20 [Nematostella vectensis]|uniref:F-box/LRR-repeat protein 20 n=1 Tax=Nematostella vectensis TaxID=45351 RepID=UPI0013903182|nr:F-box/LRR-repeat protein 20 [Nematostella vectensis]
MDEESTANGTGTDMVTIDPLVVLPSDIILFIFKFLALNEISLCRRVSRNWKRYIEYFLQHLRILDCSSLESVLSVGGLKSVLTSVKNLREICLDHCWTSVTEENILLLGSNCPKLRAIATTRCKGVTDKALQSLASCKELEELNFSSCFQISDNGLVPLFQSCPRLLEVHVSSCYGVTDRSVQALAKSCPYLRDLDVSWCHVTNEGLEAFLTSPTSLKRLRIKCCSKVTDALIWKLTQAGIIVNNFF